MGLQGQEAATLSKGGHHAKVAKGSMWCLLADLTQGPRGLEGWAVGIAGGKVQVSSLVLEPQGHSRDLNFHSEEEREEHEGDLSRVSTSDQVCASDRCWAKWGFRESRAATGQEQGCLIRTVPMETEARHSPVNLEEESRRLGLSKHEDPSSDPQHHINSRHGDCTCIPRPEEAGTTK